jgi:hypothetical protein
MVSLEVQTLGMDRLMVRLDSVRARLEESPGRLVKDASEIMVSALRTAAPKRTGELAFGVYSKVSGDRATFWDRKDYTKYVLYGTRPHDIRPALKQALYWPGARHPVRGVHHPGTRPNPFNRTGFDLALPGIRALIALVGREIVAA